MRRRVVGAMALLVSAKLLNVSVPFLFKCAVDSLNGIVATPLTMTDPQGALVAATMALITGCELFLHFISKLKRSESFTGFPLEHNAFHYFYRVST